MKVIFGFSFFCVLSFATLSSIGLSPSAAEEPKKLNSNDLIREYGKIATGLALEERCLLLPPQETREYYWHQFILDIALNKLFTGTPVLGMVQGSALQTSHNERFKCDGESKKFIDSSLQRARDLNKELNGQIFEANVSDQLFDQERITIIAAAAGSNSVCNHLLPEYDEQLRVGHAALKKSYENLYAFEPGIAAISTAYQTTSNQPQSVCGDDTRQQALQGWQLTRLLMKQARLAFATK
ncbi:hypothetical protein [Kiloniella antarctica]|uniref:Uncharacterized protein n=1 Tax=Kiloniella antarctica TaxID=1550907 RepID=A0ABW5BKX7_9PROT